MYASVRYRVLSHDEWAAKYPGHCRYTGVNQSEEPGQADSHQSEKAGTTCPKKPEPPVRTVRTKTVVKTEGIDNNKPAAADVSLPSSNNLMDQEISDSEIMGEYTTVMLDVAGRILETTAKHRKGGADFFRKVGRYAALKAWGDYLSSYSQRVATYDDYGENGEEWRKWPLQHFIDSGMAEARAIELAEARAAGTAAPAGTFAEY
jgi:hypothetical protein